MASISKIGYGYRTQIKKLGVRDSRVFRTRREAQVWAAACEREIVEAATLLLGEQHSLRDALRRYAKEVSPAKRGARWEAIRLAAFEGYALPLDIPIARVSAQHVADFRDARGAAVGFDQKIGALLHDVFDFTAEVQIAQSFAASDKLLVRPGCADDAGLAFDGQVGFDLYRHAARARLEQTVFMFESNAKCSARCTESALALHAR